MSHESFLSAIRLTACVVFSTTLMACVATQPVISKPDLNAWTARQQSLTGIEDWRMTARAGLTVDGQGYNGTLTWQQIFDDVDFRVRGPFGLGGLHINGDTEQLRVRTSTGDVFFIHDPDTDMQRELGWSIPIHSMRFWMLGLPDPSLPAEEVIDDAGRLRALEQAGWQVSYDRYADFSGWDLPRKLELEGENVRIRLAIDGWTVSLADASP